MRSLHDHLFLYIATSSADPQLEFGWNWAGLVIFSCCHDTAGTASPWQLVMLVTLVKHMKWTRVRSVTGLSIRRSGNCHWAQLEVPQHTKMESSVVGLISGRVRASNQHSLARRICTEIYRQGAKAHLEAAC